MKNLLTTIMIVFINTVFPQDAFEIKTSDAYKWAVGEGATSAEARENAKKELLNSIVTNVISAVSTSETEILSEESTNYNALFNSYTKTYSKLRLKNLKVMDQEPDGNRFYAMAYILVSDYEASISEVKVEIREMVRLAENMETAEGLIQAFYNYYLAYLNTFFSPEPVSYYSAISSDSVVSVRILLENKLRSFLGSLKIIPGQPFLTPGLEEQIEIPVSVFYKTTPAAKIAIKIDNADSPQRIIRGGKANLILYSQPSGKKQNLRLLLSPAFEEESELKELHQQFGLTEKIEVLADFSNIVKADFSIKEESNTVYAFTSEIKNLSISKTEWNFGDGTSSEDLDPKHLYKSPGLYNVTLQINSDPQLKITKQVNVAGGETVSLPPKAESKPAEKEPSTTEKPPAVIVNKTAEDMSEAVLRVTRFRDVINILDGYKARGLLSYGKKAAFVSPENCYVIIFHPVTGEMKAFLVPGNDGRQDLVTGNTVSLLSNSYKGMASIWVEVYK